MNNIIEKIMKLECSDHIHCPDDIIDGKDLTKTKRKELFGSVDGGDGSRKPEIYQRKKVVEGTGFDCDKTHTRINIRTNVLHLNLPQPNTKIDGFDYSEDFDGIQAVGDKTVYLNFKCISDAGGGQTRSLREVYWFVEAQIKYLQEHSNGVYFANILDGDECHKHMDKFQYLLKLHGNCLENIYVGDLKSYFSWFKKQLYKVK